MVKTRNVYYVVVPYRNVTHFDTQGLAVPLAACGSETTERKGLSATCESESRFEGFSSDKAPEYDAYEWQLGLRCQIRLLSPWHANPTGCAITNGVETLTFKF